MPTLLLRCDQCQTILGGASLNTPEPVPCPRCGAPGLARVFPAFFVPAPAGRAAEPVASDEEAGCFFHPRKKAAVPCQECGRFLCALCDLEIAGQHVCPSCLAAGRKLGRYPQFETQAVLHDQLAMVVVFWSIVAGLFLWRISPFVGPVIFFGMGTTTLFLVVRYWNEPGRRAVPRSRFKLVVAALLGLAQCAGAAAALYFAVRERTFFLGR